MKKFLSTFALVALLGFVTSSVLSAADEVKLKGTAMCGKCELKKDAKCNCILKVKEGDKEVLYYLSGKVNHGADFCKGTKELTVTGTPGPDKDGNKTFVVTKTE